MSITKRYFYADRPSRVHELLDEMFAKRKRAEEEADLLAHAVGATSAVGRATVEGFTFEHEDELDTARWRRHHLKTPEGKAIFVPKRVGAGGKALYQKMIAIKLPWTSDVIAALGLERLVFDHVSGTMYKSVMGVTGGRAVFVIPEDKDYAGRTIPDCLTEWKRWEHEKWLDEHQADAKPKESAL
ncbi:hypothetical protein PLUTO_00670 [Luteibacter phage vB_LflM-Pluto]|uniref:Uncharacterized protein n=1 Tax=Luteibacter phage vB_LflM-Pluto TaxID=2948611 RepID=A0A9E7MTG2_9CAUD|nr:hypothetical protein PLUTO_00670 [Luteibacter phage vB_LflM-Pluto]